MAKLDVLTGFKEGLSSLLCDGGAGRNGVHLYACV
jgi:hypothetical protein